MLHREAVLSPDTPENHIICGASAQAAVIENEVFPIITGGGEGGEVMTHNVPVSFPYSSSCLIFMSCFICEKLSQPESLACGEAELAGSGPGGLSRRPPEHDVQYGYYQWVALLIV